MEFSLHFFFHRVNLDWSGLIVQNSKDCCLIPENELDSVWDIYSQNSLLNINLLLSIFQELMQAKLFVLSFVVQMV